MQNRGDFQSCYRGEFMFWKVSLLRPPYLGPAAGAGGRGGRRPGGSAEKKLKIFYILNLVMGLVNLLNNLVMGLGAEPPENFA